ncbi:sacsin N-terminal ATP-binding-like domain-containing protein [Rossellomorea vietnamensis]|uniref:sacsin N-terminal ATP-binding-like domain-containing protein n=1 Tax=Rossellomorea vietnamensis TaxID=218284 RepID=UPI001E2F6D06|nr:hypothetical protein [Rossellomorea vietnamensis]MCC5804668.1 hypothetical protein [Rossellomorea vietnamensis]
MKNIIKSISEAFIEEAEASSQLLEDMAAMEKYVAESYGERIFIELLQNADDAGSKKMTLYDKDGHVFVANDGKPFDQNDIQSICRSGASSKKRGTAIGYRGVGFKSSSFLCEEIIIHSNNVGFTFSKKLCSERLRIKNVNKVPTIRIPLLIESLPVEIEREIEFLYKEGFTTIFVFRNAQMNFLKQEIDTVNDGYFLFLNNIEQLLMNISGVQKQFHVERTSGKISVNEMGMENTLWYVINNPSHSVQLAFRLNKDEQIIECDQRDAVFHCYLPTLESTGYPFKINCDFLTDPSRKHLTWDEQTQEALKDSAHLIFQTIKEAAKGENEKLLPVFSLLKQRNTFSKFSTCISDELENRIKNEEWIRLFNNHLINVLDCKKIPRFLENSEYLWLIENSSCKMNTPIICLKQDTGFTSFIDRFASKKYEIEDWIEILSESSFVQRADHSLLAKLYGNLLKMIRSKSLLSDITYSLNTCYIKSELNELYNWGIADNIKFSDVFLQEYCFLLKAKKHPISKVLIRVRVKAMNVIKFDLLV